MEICCSLHFIDCIAFIIIAFIFSQIMIYSAVFFVKVKANASAHAPQTAIDRLPNDSSRCPSVPHANAAIR